MGRDNEKVKINSNILARENNKEVFLKVCLKLWFFFKREISKMRLLFDAHLRQ